MDHRQNVLLTQAAALLCCAVLCCAVLCCAVLCCAVLCCAVLCCAVLCLQLHTAQSGYYRSLVPKNNEIQSRSVGCGSVPCGLAVGLCPVCVTSL